jgi:hypothetical protein
LCTAASARCIGVPVVSRASYVYDSVLSAMPRIGTISGIATNRPRLVAQRFTDVSDAH